MNKQITLGVKVLNREIQSLLREYHRIVSVTEGNRKNQEENQAALSLIRQQMIALENDRDLLIGLKGFELNTGIGHLTKSKRPIIAYNDLERLEFESVSECSKQLDIKYDSIYMHINNDRMVIKGYKFKDK